jgi:hypothetical protein
MSVRTRLLGMTAATRGGARELRRARDDRRTVNDGIAAVGRSFAVPARLRFRCECGDADCADTVALDVVEYESIRRRGDSVVAAAAR